jgi:hypothetical protein
MPITNEQITELAKIAIEEVSGVDEPANLTPGWLLSKSVGDLVDGVTDGAVERRPLPPDNRRVEQTGDGHVSFEVDAGVAGAGEVLVKSALAEQLTRRRVNALANTGPGRRPLNFAAARAVTPERRAAVREELQKAAAAAGAVWVPEYSDAELDAAIHAQARANAARRPARGWL